MRDYCIEWALGWCGNSETISVLYGQFSENLATPEFIKRIAWEAIFKLSDEANKALLQTQKIRELPTQLQELVRGGEADSLSQSLNEYLTQQTPINESIRAIDHRFSQHYYWDWRNNERLQREIKSEIQRYIPELQEITQQKFSDYWACHQLSQITEAAR
jgi:hypothetical protein